LHLDLFARQFGVQSVAFLFPSCPRLLFEPFAFGLLLRRSARSLLGQPDGFALCSGLGGLMGFPVHDEQNQDERSHRAQQHGQEGERRDLQFMPPSSHAAFPG
jgi:hypothetical protein